MLKCYCDGGAKPNPGVSCYGSFKIFEHSAHTIHKELLFVGHGTNNQAEYKTLIALLDYLIKSGTNDDIIIYMDSRLVVKQVTGVFNVRNEKLAELKAKVNKRLAKLNRVEFRTISGYQMKKVLGH